MRGFTRIAGPFGARQRTEHDIDAFADEFGRRVGMPERSQILDQLLNLLETEFLMRQLAPAKTQRDFDLHFLAQEIDRMLLFDSKVVRIDVRAQLNFLHFVGVMVLARLLVLLGLFVAELAKINQPADRRYGLRIDFDQIDSLGASQIDRLAQRQDTKVLLLCINNADFTGTDFPVNSRERGGRRK